MQRWGDDQSGVAKGEVTESGGPTCTKNHIREMHSGYRGLGGGDLRAGSLGSGKLVEIKALGEREHRRPEKGVGGNIVNARKVSHVHEEFSESCKVMLLAGRPGSSVSRTAWARGQWSV